MANLGTLSSAGFFSPADVGRNTSLSISSYTQGLQNYLDLVSGCYILAPVTGWYLVQGIFDFSLDPGSSGTFAIGYCVTSGGSFGSFACAYFKRGSGNDYPNANRRTVSSVGVCYTTQGNGIFLATLRYAGTGGSVQGGHTKMVVTQVG